FIEDAFGLQNVKFIGEDNIAYECDYPHSDTLWPQVPERLWPTIKHLTDEQIDKITHKNAMRWFRFDPFGNYKKDQLTVGALRKRAKAAGVDITLKSSGGERPIQKDIKRPVTSGDIMKMFARHGEEESHEAALKESG